MLSLNKLFGFALLLIFVSCAVVVEVDKPGNAAVNEDGANELEQSIKPYRDSLSAEMNQVIAVNPMFMQKQRPCSPIHNWSADALLVNQTGNVKLSEPVMSLLNHGGIRSSMKEGVLTLGDFYQFMPFENKVVWCRLPASYLDTISEYIEKSGGEPIAGVNMINGKLQFQQKRLYKSFWVITSDYLANGGDHMHFFASAIERMNRDLLLRDVFIQEAKKQDTLKIDQTCRMNF